MKTKYKIVKESLSPSEALYGFAGWLTTRETPITMSSKSDASIIAKFIDDFIKKQNLKEPKDHWEKDLIPMNETIFKPKSKEEIDFLKEKMISKLDNIRNKIINILNSTPLLDHRENYFYFTVEKSFIDFNYSYPSQLIQIELEQPSPIKEDTEEILRELILIRNYMMGIDVCNDYKKIDIWINNSYLI